MVGLGKKINYILKVEVENTYIDNHKEKINGYTSCITDTETLLDTIDSVIKEQIFSLIRDSHVFNFSNEYRGGKESFLKFCEGTVFNKNIEDLDNINYTVVKTLSNNTLEAFIIKFNFNFKFRFDVSEDDSDFLDFINEHSKKFGNIGEITRFLTIEVLSSTGTLVNTIYTANFDIITTTRDNSFFNFKESKETNE